MCAELLKQMNIKTRIGPTLSAIVSSLVTRALRTSTILSLSCFLSIALSLSRPLSLAPSLSLALSFPRPLSVSSSPSFTNDTESTPNSSF